MTFSIDPIGNYGGPRVYAGPPKLPVDTGQNMADIANRERHPLSTGVYVDDRMHLGIGVNDLALVKPTGDPIMSTITRGKDGSPGMFVSPWMGVYDPNPGRVAKDGNFYSKTLNPVTPAPLIPSQTLIITDLAGNGGPLMGEIALQPLLDLQALNQKGPANF